MAYSADYCHPDGTNRTKLAMIGFVDDSNGQVNSFFDEETSMTLPRLVQKAKHNVEVWTKILSVSGGSLELSKCSYHVLSWRFSIQGAPVLFRVNADSDTIQVLDPVSGQVKALEYLPPYTAHKTLGHFKEPAGTQQIQFRELKRRSDDLTAFMWSMQLTRKEAWTFYYACYLPSVCYPLTSSYLSVSQLRQIQQKAMSILVAKCGFNRHTKKEILYGPLELGGATFRDLYTEQGILQVKYVLRQWRQDSTVGRLMKCALAWTQVSVGVSYPILENTSTPLPHLEAKWFESLRGFLAGLQASIVVDDPGIPCLQREHDFFIMDKILESKLFSKAEIRKLNIVDCIYRQ
jgi:hypothetical protein